jgi:hypothetical protein
MRKPFTLFDEDWLGGQCHEIASDHKSGIIVSKEKRNSGGGWVLLTWIMYGRC